MDRPRPRLQQGGHVVLGTFFCSDSRSLATKATNGERGHFWFDFVLRYESAMHSGAVSYAAPNGIDRLIVFCRRGTESVVRV